MGMFKCSRCGEEYEDYYSPDDTCQKCKKGIVRIVEGVGMVAKPGGIQNQY